MANNKADQNVGGSWHRSHRASLPHCRLRWVSTSPQLTRRPTQATCAVTLLRLERPHILGAFPERVARSPNSHQPDLKKA